MTPLGHLLQSVMVEDTNQDLRPPVPKNLVEDQHLVNSIHELLDLLDRQLLNQEQVDKLNKSIRNYI